MNFGLIGAAGYVAPKHIKAIHDTGNTLVAATDPHDCVGRLDASFPDTRFFTEIERFDRYLEKCRRGAEGERVDYVSICSPNYLHDAHVRLALRVKAHAICEKPMVISPWNLDALEELEAEHGKRVFSVLQLRLLPSLLKLKAELDEQTANGRADICLTYITRRGRWYDASWKGATEKSGGIALNIGVHFFDLLHWLFGEVEQSDVHLRRPRQMGGKLEMEKARVRWFLSTDADDLPDEVVENGGFAYRSMTYDGQEIEFSGGFTDLHTRVYEEILAGRGTGIRETRQAIRIAHSINHTEISQSLSEAHPLVSNVSSVSLPSLHIGASKAA